MSSPQSSYRVEPLKGPLFTEENKSSHARHLNTTYFDPFAKYILTPTN